MRRRIVINSQSSNRDALLAHVAAVDLFPKVKEDYQRTQTPLGGVLSCLTLSCILILAVYSFTVYLQGSNAYLTELTVDDGATRDMPLFIDIHFPHTKCHLLRVARRDVTGDVSLDLSAALDFLPLDFDGRPLLVKPPTFFRHLSGENLDDAYTRYMSSDTGRRCGPCIVGTGEDNITNAGTTNIENGECCETCESVKRINRALDTSAPSDGTEIPQCYMKYVYDAPGCQVRGTIWLKKAPGILLFGPRRRGNRYYMQDVLSFNPSHIIHKFCIGDDKVLRFTSHGVVFPLQGHRFISTSYSEVKYFLKVVPTTYSVGSRVVQHAPTYEYSVQWSHRAIPIGVQGFLPLVMFGFDLAPMRIDNFFRRPPLLLFLVQLCSIVGGLFVVLGMVDNMVALIDKISRYSIDI